MQLLKSKSYWLSLSLMLSLAVMGLFYDILNSPERGFAVLDSPLDRIIPYVPGMSIPYLGWYPFVFGVLAYLCAKDRLTYYRVLLSMNICVWICYLIYFNFQTMVPRPELTGTGLGASVLGWLYSQDRPYNCFPSIHSLHSYLVMRAVLSVPSIRKPIKILVAAGAATIIVSTLMIKQHVIYDALGAVILGECVLTIITGLALHRRRRKESKWTEGIN
ncbi:MULTISPECIES: phosphatase PAP2 family protein [Paenibacillus]|uniref:phosphatase PAP2 family protein n=1 Tax=Paenibacillus TaxID=44249 RepID=UPI000B86772F|nr:MULTISPECIES: phosphatase PAP2 family protein [Paenibacillus]MBD8841021.1 phosphatase PAP2 family protein [Paenibacillus sp. CFBP 13594]MDQ0722920.1 membrane-associated phospholipid phosphatase [Paenibacillus sp. W4I10]PRA01634.1 inositol phosphorylceramide synthase [Paenibacillus sp. MYb63]PRA42400.1 inositol phosphorylceramide synthase [Paenibacillus sp. MYb67]QZN77621.1 phosphatase PAP2 family protein [Paenibacillus sp. DR312]